MLLYGRMTEPFQFTAETNIQQALDLDGRVVEAFRRLGLKCIDRKNEMCVAAEVETLADAARFHEFSLETLLAELNRLRIVPKPPDAG